MYTCICEYSSIGPNQGHASRGSTRDNGARAQLQATLRYLLDDKHGDGHGEEDALEAREVLHHVERRHDQHRVQLHRGGVDERGEAVRLFGCVNIGGCLMGRMRPGSSVLCFVGLVWLALDASVDAPRRRGCR